MTNGVNTNYLHTVDIAITAGSTYLDIDAYACMVALSELLNLCGTCAIAYSEAPCNYSVCESLKEDGQICKALPYGFDMNETRYVIVDVSDPRFLTDSVPLDKVIAVYDHHVGFEEYWTSRIREGTHIEFIGAAATLIYREWKNMGLLDRMKSGTSKLLIAAILDNTLNLTSSNTTEEDREAFSSLCAHAHVGEEFRVAYFSEVQRSVEQDLKNALLGDIKTVANNPILPPRIAQLCVWNAVNVLAGLDEIRGWFAPWGEPWMMNIIDISQNCSFFVCDDERYQKKIEQVFDVGFETGIAQTSVPYLRKQIIRNTLRSTKN